MNHPGCFISTQRFVRGLRNLFLILVLTFPFSAVRAQQESPDGPYYVVQPGDSLWEIGLNFGISVEDIERANEINDPDQLTAGMKLSIPGITGFIGEIGIQEIQFGDSLIHTSHRYGIPLDFLVKLNHVTSPASAYAGAPLLLPVETDEKKNTTSASLSPGQSIFDLAVANNTNPWLLKLRNGLSTDWEPLAGEEFFLPSSPTGTGEDLVRPMVSVTVDPQKLKQGKTVEIKVPGPSGISLTGSLGDYTLQFFPIQGGYVALQGIPAMAEPGISNLVIHEQYPEGEPISGETYSFSQSLLLESGNYPLDPVLTVKPETIDPEVTRPEDALWKSLGTPVTSEKLWDGTFVSPVPKDFKDCWTSLFGNRRSYNNGPYDFFHSGLDFCGREGTELKASASGKVIYTGSLIVRGNVIVIDHGWGVYTAYDHLSEQFVKVGDTVQPGQLIGLGGATGRTTGPHLHWEVWVGGVAVDPVDWLNRTYP